MSLISKTLIIIPAIDIKDGRCVRLRQGRMNEETVYSETPAEVAIKWESSGASLIHLVDLDGAISGRPLNLKTIKSIIEAINIPVQIGGGIRDEATAGIYLEMPRVKRIILGTSAIKDPALIERLTKKYPGRVAVGIDAKDGFVAIKGWVDVTDERADKLAKQLEGSGVCSIIYTDISRDGMLSGPNVEATKRLARSVDIPVVASGGISSIKDIEAYKGTGIAGIIIGKALYSGSIDLKGAIMASAETKGANQP